MSRCQFAVVLWVLVAGSIAWGQVIYQPVQYQYGQGAEVYYYGGSDPRVFERAERNVLIQRYVRSAPRAPYVTAHPVQVYSDLVPYWNAALFGFTPADARNEAYRNMPRYVRKADLLEQAVPLPTRGWVVPAQARPSGRIEIRPYNPRSSAPRPRPVLVIPKDLLDRPVRTLDRPSVVIRPMD